MPVLHTVYDLVFHQNSSASGKMARHQLEEHLQHVRKCLTCFFINFLMHYVSLIGLLEGVVLKTGGSREKTPGVAPAPTVPAG